MKRITHHSEIDYTLLGLFVYVLPSGVLVSLKIYDNGKADCQVSNANYPESEFWGQSYGMSYEPLARIQKLIPHWVGSSQYNGNCLA